MVSMMKLLRDQIGADYAACVFDAKGKTFRDDWYPEYKANRSSMPDDLALQVEPIHAVVEMLGWPIIMVPGTTRRSCSSRPLVSAPSRLAASCPIWFIA